MVSRRVVLLRLGQPDRTTGVRLLGRRPVAPGFDPSPESPDSTGHLPRCPLRGVDRRRQMPASGASLPVSGPISAQN